MTNSSGATKTERNAARELHAWAIGQGRRAELYEKMDAPDTVEGRFELLTLYVILLIERLRNEGPPGVQLSQTLFDTYVSHLDGALREMGVGDLAMGKRMRDLGEAFYGRAKACESAFAALPDEAAVRNLIGRTVMAGEPGRSPEALASYILGRRLDLAKVPVGELLSGLLTKLTV